jgi:hypothetical protein
VVLLITSRVDGMDSCESCSQSLKFLLSVSGQFDLGELMITPLIPFITRVKAGISNLVWLQQKVHKEEWSHRSSACGKKG